MGHFVRTDLAADILFDKDLDFGEDFDYYLRLWNGRRCIKIPTALFLNRIGHSAQGPRSGNGLQWRPHVPFSDPELRNCEPVAGSDFPA